MTPEQVTIIREFLHEPTHTLPLPMNNGLVPEMKILAGQNKIAVYKIEISKLNLK